MTKNQLNLRYYGDPILNKRSSEIDSITDDIKELAANMTVMMHKHDGVGLAAAQVGISKKLIVINTPSGYLQNNPDMSPGEALLVPQMPVALVNPEIISSGAEMLTAEEGCLSVPGVYAAVTRPTTIALKAQMLSGEMINIPCGGLLARILQHEIDHLDGILFIDRLTPQNYKKIKKNLDRLKKHLAAT